MSNGSKNLFISLFEKTLLVLEDSLIVNGEFSLLSNLNR